MAMHKTTNRRFTHDRTSWEVFWVTDYIYHLQKKFGDGAHLSDIKEVEDFVCKAQFFSFGRKQLGFAKHNGRYYQAVVLFDVHQKRCVVKTVYLVKDVTLLAFCKTNNI